jgi:iron only hydrogenase large subunit-like protein
MVKFFSNTSSEELVKMFNMAQIDNLKFKLITNGKYAGRIVLMSQHNYYMILATPVLKTEYWTSQDIGGEKIISEVIDIRNFRKLHPHLKKGIKNLLYLG